MESTTPYSRACNDLWTSVSWQASRQFKSRNLSTQMDSQCNIKWGGNDTQLQQISILLRLVLSLSSIHSPPCFCSISKLYNKESETSLSASVSRESRACSTLPLCRYSDVPKARRKSTLFSSKVSRDSHDKIIRVRHSETVVIVF